MRPLEPAIARSSPGHISDPRFLLALARVAYGHCPRAWSITVPAPDLALGERLSPTAERGMGDALRQIAMLIEREVGDGRCTRSV